MRLLSRQIEDLVVQRLETVWGLGDDRHRTALGVGIPAPQRKQGGAPREIRSTQREERTEGVGIRHHRRIRGTVTEMLDVPGAGDQVGQ
ncbi:hypothetical protein [Gordonia malaquae]|uniref:hypothetical protein n=1 Tax=Gordonia malaquae TaxID=410332 RepID=UPI0030FE6F99